MRTLFLVPPSFKRYDGSGTRFPATRKVKGMFYPVWLSYAAGLVKESRVLDCPAEDLKDKDMLKIVHEYDLTVIYTTTPTIYNDLRIARLIKDTDKDIKIAFVGPHVSILPEDVLKSPYVDYVARREFDYTIYELANGINLEDIKGLSWKKDDKIIHNLNRPFIENLDALPFVSMIYKRDLRIEAYRLPQLLHPYVSIYSGRGCPYQCTFCLWPQTFLGHKYRLRSPQNVAAEIRYIKDKLPQVKEILFEDDTFTANRRHAEQISDLIKDMDVTWSANARADVPYETLKKMKDAGLRLLIVGFESGDQTILNNVKKGITIERMKQFARDCHKLGIMVYGCFIIGLPGETKETIEKTLRLAKELDCDLIQCNVAMPLPGTEFYDYALKHGYLKYSQYDQYLDKSGYQRAVIEYPNLSSEELVKAVDDFHIKFYYRPRYILKVLGQTVSSWNEFKRILIDAVEFQKYIIKRYIRKWHLRP